MIDVLHVKNGGSKGGFWGKTHEFWTRLSNSGRMRLPMGSKHRSKKTIKMVSNETPGISSSRPNLSGLLSGAYPQPDFILVLLTKCRVGGKGTINGQEFPFHHSSTIWWKANAREKRKSDKTFDVLSDFLVRVTRFELAASWTPYNCAVWEYFRF